MNQQVADIRKLIEALKDDEPLKAQLLLALSELEKASTASASSTETRGEREGPSAKETTAAYNQAYSPRSGWKPREEPVVPSPTNYDNALNKKT